MIYIWRMWNKMIAQAKNFYQPSGQRALMKAANSPSQTNINDYFDFTNVAAVINNEELLRTEVNQLLGREENDDSVTPVMKLLFENAKKNPMCASKQANRHDITVNKFASSLYCLVGKGGYELLLANLGYALPSITSIQRMITCTKKIC